MILYFHFIYHSYKFFSTDHSIFHLQIKDVLFSCNVSYCSHYYSIKKMQTTLQKKKSSAVLILMTSFMNFLENLLDNMYWSIIRSWGKTLVSNTRSNWGNNSTLPVICCLWPVKKWINAEFHTVNKLINKQFIIISVI